MLHNALRATPHLSASPTPSPRRGRLFEAGRLKGNSDLSALCDLYPILPTASTHGCDVSPAQRGSRGYPPCGLSFSEFFFLRERKTGRLLRWREISVRNLNPSDGRFVNRPYDCKAKSDRRFAASPCRKSHYIIFHETNMGQKRDEKGTNGGQKGDKKGTKRRQTGDKRGTKRGI